MKILIDHGTYNNNVGEIAMLEGTVSRLKNTLADLQIFIVDRGFDTSVWHLNDVFKQKNYVFRADNLPSNLFGKLPFLSRRIPGISARVRALLLGMFLSASSLPLTDKGTDAKNIKLSEFCSTFDALHISGGGNLTDTFHYELLRKASLILAFAEQSKPVILTGQQLGPFDRRFFKTTLSRALHRVDFVGLRETTGSLTFCKEIGLGPKHFGIMGDDSFGLPPDQTSLILGLLDKYNLKSNKFLAFNVRVAGYAKEHAKYFQYIAMLIDKLADQLQMPVLFVPFSSSPMENDIETGRKLAKLTRHRDILVMEDNKLTPALVKGLLAHAFGAVGVSYHFCTFALSQGVPAICIYDGSYYSQKAQGLSGFWGDERLAFPLKDINVDLAPDHITQVLSDELLRGKLVVTAKQAIQIWQKTFDEQVQAAFGNLN